MKHGQLLIAARTVVALAALSLAACAVQPPAPRSPIRQVVLISVDGLHADAVSTLGRERVPNFFRLREEGAFTDNARTDPAIASTLPDHLSQLTSRGVFKDAGHGLFINDDPGPPVTLRLIKGDYVASVFDVVHDAGLATGFYASKTKFELFERSWDAVNGARDRTGADDGRDKIDVAFIDSDMAEVVAAFVEDMKRARFAFAFVHLREPDATGHNEDWDLDPASEYMQAIVEVDALLGDILDLIDGDAQLADSTAIILTADHSGELGEDFHLLLPDIGLVDSGIVPFYVWGPTVAAGVELYTLNASTRSNPGRSIPGYSVTPQPIRNGDAGNLALDLLELPPVADSAINFEQDLNVSRDGSAP